MKKFIFPFAFAASLLLAGCQDHDSPELAPIDTSKVKITSDVTATPTSMWLNPTEEIAVKVSNVNMTAPKGVVLRNINLMVDGAMYIQKPFAGEDLEFKLPLDKVPRGRINVAVWGELIQKNSRDAQIIIEDNIQRIIFSATPEFACDVTVDIEVKAKSTSGEEYTHTFQVVSTEESYIPVPASELYWTPQSGTAERLEITMTASAKSYSTNSTLKSDVDRVYWSQAGGGNNVLKISMPNVPGTLNSNSLSIPVLVVNTVESGTWENVTVEPARKTYGFLLTESK